MLIHFLSENTYLIDSIMDYYPSLRRQGYTRESALNTIFQEYRNEKDDEDEAAYLFIALAAALCKRNELTVQLREEALKAVDRLRKQSSYDRSQEKFDHLIKCFSEDRIGEEAQYKNKRMYDPKWNRGDTFIHAFSQPEAQKMGLIGWCIVLRKAGEYTDQEEHHMQLVYITVCKSDAVPQSAGDLQALGYLRMMQHDKGWDYLGQLYFKSRKDEERWQLQKIGCFPEIVVPSDAITENPLVSMPFYGPINRNSTQLSYENTICSLIKLYGIKKE